MTIAIGTKVMLLVPDNPRLNGATATVKEIRSSPEGEGWYAVVACGKAGSGSFRALDCEMVESMGGPLQIASKGHKNGVHATSAKEQGYSGDVCDICGSSRVRRKGSCLGCDECGSSSGCT